MAFPHSHGEWTRLGEEMTVARGLPQINALYGSNKLLVSGGCSPDGM